MALATAKHQNYALIQRVSIRSNCKAEVAFDMEVEDICPARGVNKTVGLCLLVLAGLIGMPIYSGNLYEVIHWNSLFTWFAAFTALFGFTGLYLVFTKQRVGVNVKFHRSGFKLRVKMFFRKAKEINLSWSEVNEIKSVTGSRNNSAISIHATDGLAVTWPAHLANINVPESMTRFQSAARAAGYCLENTSTRNLILIKQQVWRVSPARV